MSVSHTIVQSSTTAASRTSLQLSETVTGDQERNVRQQIPAQSGSPLTGDNYQINWSCDRSKLQEFVVSADRAVDIYTNAPSSGAYQEHIHLVANRVKIWTLQTDEIGECPFSGNITSIYVTPPIGGAAVNFSIDALVNN